MRKSEFDSPPGGASYVLMIEPEATSSGSLAPLMGIEKGAVSGTLLRNLEPRSGSIHGKSPAAGLTGSGVAAGAMSLNWNGIGATSMISTEARSGLGSDSAHASAPS